MSAPFRLVLSLEEHLPATRVRRDASSRPLHLVLLLTPSFALPWHRPSIASFDRDSKATTCPQARRRLPHPRGSWPQAGPRWPGPGRWSCAGTSTLTLTPSSTAPSRSCSPERPEPTSRTRGTPKQKTARWQDRHIEAADLSRQGFEASPQTPMNTQLAWHARPSPAPNNPPRPSTTAPRIYRSGPSPTSAKPSSPCPSPTGPATPTEHYEPPRWLTPHGQTEPPSRRLSGLRSA